MLYLKTLTKHKQRFVWRKTMSLVMLYLVTFDDFGLIHQTKRALKSNRTNLLWGAFFCTLLFSQKKFCTIQCDNPEGLLAIYFTSKSEEKISIILWHLLSDHGIKLIINTRRCLIWLNFMYLFQVFIFQFLKLMQMAPTVSHLWYYLSIISQDPKLLMS